MVPLESQVTCDPCPIPLCVVRHLTSTTGAPVNTNLISNQGDLGASP